jgi:hypothetical protein
MPNSPTQIVKINSQGDLVFALTQMLGFRPEESVVIACMNGERQRIGLTLRYDLDWLLDTNLVEDDVERRVRGARPDDIFIAVFSDRPPEDGELPFLELVDSLGCRLGDLIIDIALIGRERWWSYGCDDPLCCPAEGTVIDPGSPGATELKAAYAMHGKAVLPNREAVVLSLGYHGDEAAADAIGDRIEDRLCDHQVIRLPERRAAMRELLSRLCAASHDPRSEISDDDVVEFVALLEDVLVRDEVVVRAGKSRRRQTIITVLCELARRTPFPYDGPLCATLAYVAYADGNGIIANVALERAFAADPEYSLAHLTAEALSRQVPPWLARESMRSAAHALKATREMD